MSTINQTKEFKAKCQLYKAFDKPLKSVEQVNSWCAKNTNNKITSILDNITEETRLLVLNATYFLGKWKQSFNKEFTSDELFYNSKKETINCKMMKQKMKAPFKAFTDCNVIQLDYSEKKVNAIVILPLIPIDDYIMMLTDEKLLHYSSGLSKETVIFGLPHFHIESSEKMNGYLQSLGINKAFDEFEAEFQKMFQPKEIYYISNVVQKSFIKVNEEGTEAASVTKVEVQESCGRLTTGYVYMTCNHPFLFIIKHQAIQEHCFFIIKVEQPI